MSIYLAIVNDGVFIGQKLVDRMQKAINCHKVLKRD